MEQQTAAERVAAKQAEAEAHQAAVQLGANEIADSLNGFDEIAIRQQFGVELEDLGNLTTLRALVFTLRRRDGLSDPEARKASLEATSKAVQAELAQLGGVGDVFEDEPDSDQGKGDSAPESEPTS